jgi:hypothetical protein
MTVAVGLGGGWQRSIIDRTTVISHAFPWLIPFFYDSAGGT